MLLATPAFLSFTSPFFFLYTRTLHPCRQPPSSSTSTSLAIVVDTTDAKNRTEAPSVYSGTNLRVRPSIPILNLNHNLILSLPAAAPPQPMQLLTS
jgi:hypothetical protein